MIRNLICLIVSIAFVATIALLPTDGFSRATESFSLNNSTNIDYFKGNWVVKMKDNPKASFNWTVKDDLDGGWTTGVVERNGVKVSTDFWRQNDKLIERYAFTSDGAFVKIESFGWESNRLILTGTMSGKSGETKVRETITKVNEREFNALWERENSDGKWIKFSDEICTK